MTILLAAGANEAGPAGQPADAIAAALDLLEEDGRVRVTATSRLYRSPAFPAGAGPDFANAAALAESDLTPEAMLAALHAVEARLGRVRRGRWGPRAIDLDLLAVNALVRPDPRTEEAWRALAPQEAACRAPQEMILPHPRLAERAFVLVPLAELTPHWCHPTLGRTVAEMLDARPAAERESVIPLPPRPQVLRRIDLGAEGRPSQTSHTVGGMRQQRFHGLEIVRLPGARGVELRYLDPSGREAADSWHACLTDALTHAEREFELARDAWRTPLRPWPDGPDAA